MTCCFLECSLVFPENNYDKDHPDEESLLGYEKDEDYRSYKCIFSLPRLYRTLRKFKNWIYNKCTSKGCRNCCRYTCLSLWILIFLITMVLFVALPLVFKHSVVLQRNLIFHPVRGPSYLYKKIAHDDNNQYYNGKKTFSHRYVEVNKIENITLGTWNISLELSYRPYNRNPVPNMLYFHSGVGDRRSYTAAYYTLANTFNVTTFDYRSYGDSSVADLTESGLVDDSIRLYKWLLNQSNGDVYIMGDKLGASIATHMVAKLQKENLVPTGLILVDPFTSLSDKIKEWFWPLGRIFSWMPWYDSMVTDVLQRNDLAFETSRHIGKVDCPIMVMAKYYTNGLPDKLALIASERDPATQGTVILRQTWWSPKDNWSTTLDLMKDFLDECNDFKKSKGKI
ncbi:hypothetical protein RN001_015324 [Aquatica leii]|uniref:Alpha/beta hydrolase fold-3 domain-containing protein n=1 Tax=Aquatica leii TaxID=1421715 RepID=A0AAN7NVH9_9COLE|nr:hypothetical protein RN001_015324 [Aquatica leii]